LPASVAEGDADVVVGGEVLDITGTAQGSAEAEGSATSLSLKSATATAQGSAEGVGETTSLVSVTGSAEGDAQVEGHASQLHSVSGEVNGSASGDAVIDLIEPRDITVDALVPSVSITATLRTEQRAGLEEPRINYTFDDAELKARIIFGQEPRATKTADLRVQAYVFHEPYHDLTPSGPRL